MNKNTRLQIAGGVLSALVLIFSGCSAPVNDFSADSIIKSGRESFAGKVFVAGTNVRLEMQGAVSITRLDKKVVWVLMPAQMMYMEQPLDMQRALSSQSKVEGEIERTLMGKELVDGRMSQKFKVTYQYQGRKDAVYQWIAPGLSLPIKTAAINGNWSTEYRNIRAGAQPKSLFEIPPGYKQFSYEKPSMKDILGGAATSLF